MRNLKKVLALVLTLAMMLSVMVMNVGAFTDDKDIQHKEAAAVANAIGVLKGYEDGSYGPANILNRAEAATICARLLQGPEKADALKTSEKPFNDVETTDWFAGYVAYCKSEKIINGVGSNNFAPEDTLTIAQFSKILLCALGYDAEAEGMTGSAWSINTAKLAQKNDLLDEIDTAFDADCNRDDAAQMILNLLKADMVEYDNAGTSVTTSDGTTITVNGSKAEKMENNSSTDGNIDQDGGDGIMQFAEKYFEDLELDEAGTSDYGRPSNIVWTNDGDDVYSEGDTADLKATFYGQTKKVDMYNAIGSTAFKDYTLKVFGDGAELSVDKDKLFAKSGTAKAEYKTSATGPNVITDGVTIEVYVDKDAKQITVCMFAEYLAQATDDYDDEDENLAIDVFDKDVFGVRSTDLDEDTLDLDDFANITEFADEDYMVVTISKSATDSTTHIVTVAAAESVTGDINSMSGSSSKSTCSIDGTSYNVSCAVTCIDEYDPAVKDTVDVYLDSNGNIVGVAEVESNDNYVFIEGVYPSTSSPKSPVVADAYFTDGTNEEITLKSVTPVSGSKLSTTAELKTAKPDQWYTYTESDGKYVLKEVKDVSPKFEGAGFQSGEVKFLLSGSGSVVDSAKANNATVFLVVNEDDELDVYTGYKNIPDVTAQSSGMIYQSVKDGDFCTYVFLDAGNAKIKGSSSSSSDLLFIYDLSDASSGVDADENEYYTINAALVNGEEKAVSALQEDVSSWFDGPGLYTDVEYDEDGYIVDATYVGSDYYFSYDEDDFSFDSYDESSASYKEGVLTIGTDNYTLTDDCIIYVANASDSDWSTKKAAKVKGVDGLVFGVKNSDGDFTALYILEGLSLL